MPSSPNGFQLSRPALIIVSVMLVLSLGLLVLAPRLASAELPLGMLQFFGASFTAFYGALLGAPYLSVWERVPDDEEAHAAAQADVPANGTVREA